MLNGKENYFKSADNGHRLLVNRSKSKYFQEVIKVIDKYDGKYNMYLKFIKPKKDRYPGYKTGTIIRGFDYDKLMNYLNYRNNLDSIVCICEAEENFAKGDQNKVSPVKTLEYLKDNFNRLKGDGLITSQKDFITVPIYNGEFNNGHWTVAVISK